MPPPPQQPAAAADALTDSAGRRGGTGSSFSRRQQLSCWGANSAHAFSSSSSNCCASSCATWCCTAQRQQQQWQRQQQQQRCGDAAFHAGRARHAGISHGYPQQQRQQMPVQHHNPVIAAMLSQGSLLQTSSHCPVLHATMAALSNQGACACVYCVTSSSRKQQQQQQGLAGLGAVPHTPGITAAQLASLAMPPPRPVVMAGKPAAAAAAATAEAGAGAGPTSLPGSSSSLQQQQQGCGRVGDASLSNVTSSTSSLATYGAFDYAAFKSSSTSQYTITGGTDMYASSAVPAPAAATSAAEWGAAFILNLPNMGMPGLDTIHAGQQQQQVSSMHGTALAN
ncbi:hypothetical protein COO60DRAFT_681728 [Scenedesmus sp. NREL 46B-D3]|nr:hypothetical protein COO60DRAFT_681728 [Scenedesmus sp. NREL 46B-D3]